MKGLQTTLFILLTFAILNGQTKSFIDSLKINKSNQILIFEENCSGCIVLNSPCKAYSENGNPWDKYVIWKNKEGYHIKKFNACGSSDILTFKSWKKDPFQFIKSNSLALDTSKIRYPLSLNRKDSTWFETGLDHYKYYNFSFPTFKIRDFEVKDYAFRKVNEEDEVLLKIDFEFRKNVSRYEFNNLSAIKTLLDIVNEELQKMEMKLVIAR
ncbi:MAG: hypothetical protein IAF38_14555 [Bacteroidia bacterium]|nr:hypothetical protein [Bacteroidia bacterium]